MVHNARLATKPADTANTGSGTGSGTGAGTGAGTGTGTGTGTGSGTTTGGQSGSSAQIPIDASSGTSTGSGSSPNTGSIVYTEDAKCGAANNKVYVSSDGKLLTFEPCYHTAQPPSSTFSPQES